MKTFYYLLLLFTCISFDVFSQEEISYPSVYREQCFTKYPKAIKVHCKKYNHFSILDEWEKYYDYSKDSLNLTIKAPWGKQYIKYNPDKTMASFSSPVNNWNDAYTYDKKGRIIKVQSKSNNKEDIGITLYKYEGNITTRTSFLWSEIYNKYLRSDSLHIIYYNDKIESVIYIYNYDNNKWEDKGSSIYQLDNTNRIIEKVEINDKGNYIVSAKYIYTENGYIEISKYLGNTYRKLDYTFNDQGDLICEKWYEGTDVNNLTLSSITDYTYTYPDPTSNEEIKPTDYKVYSANGNLIIENNNGSNKKASIYAITGQYLRTISVSNSRTEVPLSSGIYILVIDNQTFKARVK